MGAPMGQPPQIGDVVAGKYRIEAVLGRGGMGVVFAARHALSERPVALKWMEADRDAEPDALARFVREARAMGRIEHPNVVGVLDVGTEGEVAYLVMEILRGESLRSAMTKAGPMEAGEALRLLFPALEGVEAAHRVGVVHRDLKPENLFVVHGAAGSATTKVLDFGISKLTEHEGRPLEAQKLTKTGHVVGTPTYMSPEQVRGGTIDARTDVWALSVILYEMLAGRTPFAAESYGALLVAIAVEPYEPLDPELVPPDLARVVHRGLAKEAGDRWPTVQALAHALEPFAGGARYREPRHPSMPPAQSEERASSLPTAAGRPRPVEGARSPEGAPAVATPAPDLELASVGRGSRATASAPGPARAPAPIRLGSAGASASSSDAPTPPPSRRWLTLAALALAIAVALGLVVRQLGHAARDAMLSAPVASTQPDPGSTPRAPTPLAPSRASAAPTEPTRALDPPPLPVPPLASPGAHPPRPPRHGEHERPPPASTTVAPTTTIPSAPTSPPPTTTPASRSGSISRDDF